MSEPSDEQVNKKIAEFMGGLYCVNCGGVWETTYFETGKTDCGNCIYGEQRLYTRSLDASALIVEKIGWQFLLCYDEYTKEWDVGFRGHSKYNFYNKSPSQALARAIFEIIK